MFKTKFAVDHNAVTRAVRDLLCIQDNVAFGLLKEDPARIRGLLAYAEKWKNHTAASNLTMFPSAAKVT